MMSPANRFVELYASRVEAERSALSVALAATDLSDQAQVLADSRYGFSSFDQLWTFEGCTDEEIEEVRSLWGGFLPDSYEAFLSMFGLASYFLEVGFDCRYPAVLEAERAVEEWRTEMLTLRPEWYGDGERFRIPERVYHLGHHEGYKFFFFLDECEDPVIWRMTEGSAQRSGVAALDKTFSSIVASAIESPRKMVERRIRAVRRRNS